MNIFRIFHDALSMRPLIDCIFHSVNEDLAEHGLDTTELRGERLTPLTSGTVMCWCDHPVIRSYGSGVATFTGRLLVESESDAWFTEELTLTVPCNDLGDLLSSGAADGIRLTLHDGVVTSVTWTIASFDELLVALR